MRPYVSAVLLLAFFVVLVPAQKTRFGQEPPKAKAGVDYPVKIHISGIHLRTYCTGADASCSAVIYADAMRDGQKIELMGDEIWLPERPIGLVPADYQARLLKAGHQKGSNPIGDKYELVFPDQTIWRCSVTGISE
jgi:hypothetical protein